MTASPYGLLIFVSCLGSQYRVRHTFVYQAMIREACGFGWTSILRCGEWLRLPGQQ